jgi:acetylornithine/N-succinyldiaminopimelate aminotransferase
MYIWNTHVREQIDFEKGKGVYLQAENGEKYLDLSAGGAVNSLGYSNKKLVFALIEQSKKIWHLSNYYRNKKAESLAEEFFKASAFDASFFCNSGSEAVEGAIKLTRKYFHSLGSKKYEIISLQKSFHGRTMGALSTSSNPLHTEGYGPFLKGFISATPDIKKIEKTITAQTAAIIVEPIQGEGGINFLGWEFLFKVKELCARKNILLIFDEVQTGMGRTGKLFAFEWAGVRPDIVVLAKGIAGGFPMGAVLTTKRLANVINPGSHGTTFGGNLLAITCAIATLKQINQPGFLNNVLEASGQLEVELQKLIKSFPELITEIKGFGLMRGISIKSEINAKEISKAIFEEKVLVGVVSGNVIRITPPLIITAAEIKKGFSKIKKVLNRFYGV